MAASGSMRWIWRFATAGSMLSILGACTVGPDFARPDVPQTQRYTPEAQATSTVEAAGVAQRFHIGDELPADWWRLFGSEAVNAAMSQALRANPSLQAAQASLRESEANLRAGQGVFFPSVSVGAELSRARSNPALQGASVAGAEYSLATANVAVTYLLDVFGQERRTVEALAAQVEEQRYLAQAVYLTLSANVVNTLIAHAAYAAQIQELGSLIEVEKEQLRSVEAQVRAGTAPYSDTLLQETLIANNMALIAPLRQKLSQAEHLLASLTGNPSSDFSFPRIDLGSLTLPADIPVSLPSEWVRRRPDILAAEAQWHVASANIGVATAAMFPSFNLTAAFGSAGAGVADLFKSGGEFWSLGAALAAPIFSGGRLSAQRQAAIAEYEVQQANYRHTVLAAFQQVADALNALEHDAQALQAESEALKASKESLGLLSASYAAGMAAYIDVLVADAQFHQAAIGYQQALAQRLQDTVALFLALGGGWWNAASAQQDAQ